MSTALQYVGAFLVSIGGGTAILFALSSWLGKVWAERILEADRAKYSLMVERSKSHFDRVTRQLQAGLEHRVSVSRVQFDVEFAALREIWKFIAEVRRTMFVVRPSESADFESQDEELERLKANVGRFIEAQRKFTVAIDNNSVFYPIAIYEAVDQLRKRTAQEIGILTIYLKENIEPFTDRWYQDGDKAIEDVKRLIEGVEAAIRLRLSELTVRVDPPVITELA